MLGNGEEGGGDTEKTLCSDMSAIPFTDRELKRAWRDLSSVATSLLLTDRSNPHRLLLFYAVECGLKAVWLKRQSRSLFRGEDISSKGHDLRQILKDLRVGSDLALPEYFQLPDVTDNSATIPRKGKFGELHQVWRYGGSCSSPTDKDCELKLENVLTWIQGELR